jgi:hypothetical protein
MKKYLILAVLAMLTMTGAVAEGLFAGLPQPIVQVNGLLTIIFAIAFVIWTLKIQAGGFRNRD